MPHRPTLPFTHEEMIRILGALDPYIEQAAPCGRDSARRLRTLTLILRFSGMRIGDAVRLTTDQINGNKLILYTQKTGVPVNAVLLTTHQMARSNTESHGETLLLERHR